MTIAGDCGPALAEILMMHSLLNCCANRATTAASRSVAVITLALAISAMLAPAGLADEAPSSLELRTLRLKVDAAAKHVEEAQAEVTVAKDELDTFVARHFEHLYARSQAPLPEKPAPREPLPPPPQAPADPERQSLTEQLQQLVTRRDELLDRLTIQHPEVIDLEQRIAEHTRRLAALGEPVAAGESVAPGTPDQLPGDQPDQQLTERLAQDHELHVAATEQYGKLLDRWQEAVRTLSQAKDEERKASESLTVAEKMAADLAAKKAAKIEQTKTSAVAVVEHPPATTENAKKHSQPLALAALLIALAVAALGAVRLARSSSVNFNTLEEISAALALPVVGVIPANKLAGPNQTVAAAAVRTGLLIGELLLAFLIFAAIAYSFQAPGFVWQLITDPLTGLRGAAEFFGLR